MQLTVTKLDSTLDLSCESCQFNKVGTCSILRTDAEGGCNLYVERNDAQRIKRVEKRNGLKIGITHDPGDLRFQRSMKAGYGHLRGSYGKAEDGMAIDVYLGSDINSPKIYKVRQIDPQSGELDEHKYFVGYNSTKKVKDTFCYHAGSDRFGGVEAASEVELAAYRQDRACGCSSTEELLESGVVEVSPGLSYALEKADPEYLGTVVREILESKFPDQILDIPTAVKTDMGVRGTFTTLDDTYNFASKGWRILGWKRRSSKVEENVVAWASPCQTIQEKLETSHYETVVAKNREDAKKIGSNTWVHRSNTQDLSDEQRSQLSKARSIAGSESRGSNLYKFSPGKVSFLFYPNFESETNPALFKSAIVDLKSGSMKVHQASKTNPPILHRKETFVNEDDPNFAKYRQQTLSQEQKGYLKQTSKIGTKKGFAEIKKDSPTEVANSTDRPGGVFGGKPIVYKTAKRLVSKSDKILDFGAGKNATYTQEFRKAGYNVTAYDFGENVGEIHDRSALSRQYDVVMASNVLNVQSTDSAFNRTLSQIKKAIAPSGFAIINYPDAPRKLNLSTEEFKSRLGKQFNIEPVGVNVYKITHTNTGGKSDAINEKLSPLKAEHSFSGMVSKVNASKAQQRDFKGFKV